ncbi:hypothetical protein FNH05_31120 [Amycolatopsis rhizosphaerae]|uniref:MarR family transcriptional regulator n=1 Tax=Amycolatopsis rhizosphaerae TaxID=2053003 RepID=A0A558ARG6_9PSEU|nr:hypothetical protein [Amycolatopsis rhizosphaerae]TVT26842.1 hypothetical protein FNH05_31120 [Amycolatopsis rhizosphaerae]
MVAAGLLRRESASDDRRRIEISCTPQGRELARAARERKETFRDWLRDRLDGLGDTPLAETVR